MRVYPGGRKAFFYRYRVGGGQAAQIREPRIGDLGEFTPIEARSIAKDWVAIVRRGGDPMASVKRYVMSPRCQNCLIAILEIMQNDTKNSPVFETTPE